MGMTSGSTTTSRAGMPWSIARSTIFFATAKAHVRIFGYPGLVVGNRDDRGTVLLDQRQYALQTLILAGHRIDQRLALVDGKPGLERGDDG